MAKVFISHSVKDCEFVEKELLPLFQKHRIDTWYSQDDIQTAEKWEKSIRRALERCEWFLVVLSPRSAASKWVAREVHWAMEERDAHLIPVLIETCDLKDWHLGFRELQYVDFRKNKALARKKLIGVLGLKKQPKEVSIHDEDITESSGNNVGVAVQTDTAPIELVINRDFHSYTSKDQEHLLSAIKELLGVDGDIRVIRKKPGSVKLTLELTPQQAEQLLWAVRGGDFASFGVVEANLLEITSRKNPQQRMFQDLAQQTGLTRKQVASVFDELKNYLERQLGKKGAGVVNLAGLLKIKRVEKKPTPARQGRNPKTGETVMIPPKPKRAVVRAVALKQLKEIVK
jgi:nucleoid DNA-binding protein